MKTFVVGDIHGAYKALKQVLERSGFNKEEDLLIQLGDVADGWPEVYECVEELLSCKNTIFIRGNHDEWTKTYLETGVMDSHHKSQGGVGTFNSYSSHSYKPSHLTFFTNQLDYYKDDRNRLFIHGGFNRHYPLAEQLGYTFYWDRDFWMSALSYKSVSFEGISEKQGEFKIKEEVSEVYIGHTATTSWKIDTPMTAANDVIWNLDTGAGWNGKLTIMDIDTKQFWQSDQVQLLYPNCAGRDYVLANEGP